MRTILSKCAGIIVTLVLKYFPVFSAAWNKGESSVYVVYFLRKKLASNVGHLEIGNLYIEDTS